MARGPVPARKGGELVDQAGAIARSAELDEVALQRIAADARRLMASDAAGAHMVLGIVAAVRGDAALVRKHYGIALGMDRSAVTWFNYSMSLAAVDEHAEALARISHQAACRRQKALGFHEVDRDVDDRADCGLRWPRPRGSFGPVRARAPSTVVPAMLSVASTRTGPKSSAIITAPGEKCGLAVAHEGLEGHADDAGLTDRAAEAALESGRFREAEILYRRRERLNAEGAYRSRDEVRQLSAAVESGTMTEAGAAAVIELMTKVQREAGAKTVGLEIRRDGAGAFLYDRYVRCSSRAASGLNWAVTGEIVDREDLHVDPGRAFLVGFVGVADGGNA